MEKLKISFIVNSSPARLTSKSTDAPRDRCPDIKKPMFPSMMIGIKILMKRGIDGLNTIAVVSVFKRY